MNGRQRLEAAGIQPCPECAWEWGEVSALCAYHRRQLEAAHADHLRKFPPMTSTLLRYRGLHVVGQVA